MAGPKCQVLWGVSSKRGSRSPKLTDVCEEKGWLCAQAPVLNTVTHENVSESFRRWPVFLDTS